MIKDICLLGPDSLGNFAVSQVEPEFSVDCDRETCTCDSHDDFVEKYRERILQAGQVHQIKTG